MRCLICFLILHSSLCGSASFQCFRCLDSVQCPNPKEPTCMLQTTEECYPGSMPCSEPNVCILSLVHYSDGKQYYITGCFDHAQTDAVNAKCLSMDVKQGNVTSINFCECRTTLCNDPRALHQHAAWAKSIVVLAPTESARAIGSGTMSTSEQNTVCIFLASLLLSIRHF